MAKKTTSQKTEANQALLEKLEALRGDAFTSAVEAVLLRQVEGAGRPMEMTPDIVAAICIRMAEGETINTICDDTKMPSARTVRRWKANHPEFAKLYSAAHEALVENWADEMVDIADDSRNDFIERTRKDGSVELAYNPEAVQRAKLRVDTRKWLLSKLLQERYGDKIEVGGKDGGPITIRFVE